MSKVFQFKNMLTTMLVAVMSAAFYSCGSDDEEVIDDGSTNTTDIAVTGKVTEFGVSYATVEGFLNLQLINVAYSEFTVGVEYSSEETFKLCKRDSTKEISGNKITITVKDLLPNKKYYYRTYVEVNGTFFYGKDIKSFITKGIDVNEIVSIRRVRQNDPISIGITCNVKGYDQKNAYIVGVCCSKNEKTDINNSNRYYYGEQNKKTSITQINKDSCNFEITSLYPDSTYYITPFIQFGDSLIYGQSNKHTVPGISNLLVTKSILEQHYWEATFECTSSIKQLYPNFSRVEYGVILDESQNGKVYSRNDYGNNWPNVSFSDEKNYSTTLSISSIDTLQHYYHACVRINSSFVIVASGKPFNHPKLPSGNIDLGLSCLWASSNLGASKPEDKGDVYKWGATEKMGWVQEDDGSSVYTGGWACYEDVKDIISTDKDMAFLLLGASMRLPSLNELKELLQCNQRRIVYHGTNGVLFTGYNGNSIFLPSYSGMRLYKGLYVAGGSDGYWSGNSDGIKDRWGSWGAYCIYPFNDNGLFAIQEGDRTCDFRIRPVSNK